MNSKRQWYGVKEHETGTGPLAGVLRSSCRNGNFNPPTGRRGYWVEWDESTVNEPKPQFWFAFSGQLTDPWPKDWVTTAGPKTPIPDAVMAHWAELRLSGQETAVRTSRNGTVAEVAEVAT
jgi:hypothetical protein